MISEGSCDTEDWSHTEPKHVMSYCCMDHFQESTIFNISYFVFHRRKQCQDEL